MQNQPEGSHAHISDPLVGIGNANILFLFSFFCFFVDKGVRHLQEATVSGHMKSLPPRIVNGSVPDRVHDGSRTETVKDKMELDPDPEPFWNRFFSSGTRTIYRMDLDMGPGLSRE